MECRPTRRNALCRDRKQVNGARGVAPQAQPTGVSGCPFMGSSGQGGRSWVTQENKVRMAVVLKSYDHHPDALSLRPNAAQVLKAQLI